MATLDDSGIKFESVVSHLIDEFKNIRTGRANPMLVEELVVDYYGTPTPLQQVASISTPDANSIVIQPWDKTALKDIEKSIQASDLGLNPVNEGESIRLPIPPLTEDRRKELVKVVNTKTEEAHVAIRSVREDIWKATKDQKTNGDISEDDMYQQQKDLQKMVDEFNKKIKNLSDVKEKEIMAI